jgi:hypothetical protein
MPRVFQAASARLQVMGCFRTRLGADVETIYLSMYSEGNGQRAQARKSISKLADRRFLSTGIRPSEQKREVMVDRTLFFFSRAMNLKEDTGQGHSVATTVRDPGLWDAAINKLCRESVSEIHSKQPITFILHWICVYESKSVSRF